MSNALAVRRTAADSQAKQNAASSAQVKRYWPGRAPDWYEKQGGAAAAGSESEDEAAEARPEEEPAVTAVAAPVVLKKVQDPRLARLQAATGDGIAAPRVVSRRQARGESDDESGGEAEAASEESEEEDEAVTARRMAVRQRLQQQKAAEPEELLPPPASDAEEEEEESEYETDSEDEAGGRAMLKPIFVPKAARETIAEREALEQEEEQAMAREKAKLAERAAQTKELVVEQLRAEEEAARAAQAGPKQVGDIDTDDEKDPEGEYEAWRGRELARIRRDREEAEAQANAEAERARIAAMTPAERAAWEAANPRIVHQAPKKSWKFMQKYWHRGAFFQAGADGAHGEDAPDEIYLRDHSAPVGEDKLNKEILPKVMQVKNFGRRGRTKYTHLLDQDTSVRDDYHTHEGLGPPGQRRLTGTQDVFEKPKRFNT